MFLLTKKEEKKKSKHWIKKNTLKYTFFSEINRIAQLSVYIIFNKVFKNKYIKFLKVKDWIKFLSARDFLFRNILMNNKTTMNSAGNHFIVVIYY